MFVSSMIVSPTRRRSFFDNTITWISLCVPPFMFAIILVTIKAITRTGHRPGG